MLAKTAEVRSGCVALLASVWESLSALGFIDLDGGCNEVAIVAQIVPLGKVWFLVILPR